jgi:hypothetical protein
MNITTDDIKKLRDLTGVGIGDAKNALEEAGSVEEAVALLRKKGHASLAKKATRGAPKKELLHPTSTPEARLGSCLNSIAKPTLWRATKTSRPWPTKLLCILLLRLHYTFRGKRCLKMP